MTKPGPFYKLDGRTPVPATAEEYFAFQQAYARSNGELLPRVGYCRDEARGVVISTIFLGIDTGFRSPPRLFETMILGGLHHGYQVRVATWDEAEAEHAKALRIAGMLT